MAYYENIVSSEESEKTIDKPIKIDPPKKAPKLKPMEYDVLPGNVKQRFTEDKNYYKGLDVEDYSNDYNKGNVVVGFGGVEALNQDRANQQGFLTQFGNMIGQAAIGEVVGGTIEGFGYIGEVGNIAKYISGEEVEFGNWLTDIGKDTREFSQDYMPIYQTNQSLDPNSSVLESMGDSGWWASNGVSVASSLSMLIPTGAATKALSMLGKELSVGLGAINKSLNIASKMGKYEKWMAKGITQAVISRHIENSMEASGVFNEQKKSLQSRINPKTGVYFTEDESNKLAGVAASSTYNSDWAMLIQDIPQYLALGKVFNPATMKMESKVAETLAKGVTSGWKAKALAGAGTFASEGAEESIQYYIAERGKLLSDLRAGLITEREYDRKTSEKIGDKEMLTSGLWGGLGGNIFQAAGKGTSELFKSKATRNAEENYASIQGDYIKRRGDSFKLMQKEVALADQTGDPARRQAAIDGSGANMAIDAVRNGKFAEYVESLQGMADMSQEEIAGFEQKMDTDLDSDLFKKYVPALIEQAHELRSSYLKHLNKNDPNIASKISFNDYYVKSFDNRARTVEKEIKEIKDSVPNSKNLTSYYKDRFDTTNELLSLKRANAVHESAIKNTDSEFAKGNRKELIEKNNKLISELSNKMLEFEKNDPRTHDEKNKDKLIGAGLEVSTEDLITKSAESILLSDSINLMQKDSIKLQDKDYQKELRDKEIANSIDRIASKEELEQAESNLKENDAEVEKEKKQLLLDKKKKSLENAEKRKLAKSNQEQHPPVLKKETDEKAELNPVVVPNASISKVSIIEDEQSSEESDINKASSEKEEVLKSKSLSSFLNIGMSGIFGKNGKNYTELMLNGKGKIGMKVSVVNTKGQYATGVPSNVLKAILDFDNGVLNPNVYNYLPLKAIFDKQDGDLESDEKSAYLGGRIEVSNPEKREAYEALWVKDYAIRIAIIDHILANKTFETTVAAQYGGRVTRSPLIDGLVPENNIADLQQVKVLTDERFDLNGELPTSAQVVETIESRLMYTDEYGVLNNINGEKSLEYLGREMTLPLLVGSESSAVPMRGALFLSTVKADGTLFPLKLNVKRHTRSEAEIIAELLVSIVKKDNTGSTSLSLINNETGIRDKIIGTMGAELDAMLSEDPSVSEIINLFTYVDPNTKGKASELFIEKAWIKDESGKWVKDNSQDVITFAKEKITNKSLFNQDKLVEFLVNTKRRQFNIDLWQESPAYREYAIQSGLINTDSVVNAPLFTGNTGMYIKAPATSISKKRPDLKNLVANPLETKSKRIQKTKDYGIKTAKDSKGKFEGIYYDKSGSGVQILRDTIELVKQEINNRYENETSKTPLAEKPIKTKPTENVKKSMDAGLSLFDAPVDVSENVKKEIKKEIKEEFKKDVKKEDVIEKAEVIEDWKSLFGVNSLDLANETAVKQDNLDESSLDKVNNSLNEVDKIAVPDIETTSYKINSNDPELSNLEEDYDSLSYLFNNFEDDQGC